MSYLPPFILFVLGVIIWRLQLGAKRRFELAEQTLMAFQRASDGLSRLRDPFIYTGVKWSWHHVVHRPQCNRLH